VETDEQTRREYESHFWYDARDLLKTPAPLRLPLGHAFLSTMPSMAEERRLRSRPGHLCTWGAIERGGSGGAEDGTVASGRRRCFREVDRLADMGV
jgi:hypothetical protein